MPDNTASPAHIDHLYNHALVQPLLQTALEDTKDSIRRARMQIIEAHKDAYAILRVMQILDRDAPSPSAPTSIPEASNPALPSALQPPEDMDLRSMNLEQATLLSLDPEATIERFLRTRGEGTIACPKCRRSIPVHKDRPKPDRFRCERCNHTFTLKNNTAMHGSKHTLGKWFLAAYLIKVYDKPYNANALADHLQIAPNAAANLITAINAACGDNADPIAALAALLPPPEDPEEPRDDPNSRGPDGPSAPPHPKPSAPGEGNSIQKPAARAQDSEEATGTPTVSTGTEPATAQPSSKSSDNPTNPTNVTPDKSQSKPPTQGPRRNPAEQHPKTAPAFNQQERPLRYNPVLSSDSTPTTIGASRIPCPKCGPVGIKNDDLGPRCIQCDGPIPAAGKQLAAVH